MTKTKARQIAKEMRTNGYSWQEVADELNSKNFTTATGKSYSYGSAHDLLYKRKKKSASSVSRKRGKVSNPRVSPVTNGIIDAIAEIATNPSMSGEIKMEIMRRLIA